MWTSVLRKVTAVRAAPTPRGASSAGAFRATSSGLTSAAAKLWVSLPRPTFNHSSLIGLLEQKGRSQFTRLTSYLCCLILEMMLMEVQSLSSPLNKKKLIPILIETPLLIRRLIHVCVCVFRSRAGVVVCEPDRYSPGSASPLRVHAPSEQPGERHRAGLPPQQRAGVLVRRHARPHHES